MPERITVSVTSGANEDERHLRFPRPEKVASSDLLERGLAIDGDHVVLSVFSHWDPDARKQLYTYPRFNLSILPTYGQAESFPYALAAAQEALVDFLRSYDYEVEFV